MNTNESQEGFRACVYGRSDWARKFSLFCFYLCSSAFIGGSGVANAQQKYPSKPLRFVVPYPAGGPLDTVARLLGQKVSESTKQPVIVDNKPGAGGNIGADAVAKSPADGYTILMGAVATHAINPALYASMPYDAVRDFTPVTQVASTPNVLVVNPSSLAQVRAGRIRALAVTTGKRTALAPELPTIAESGLPGFDISTWFGIFVPAGTPREVVERLHAEFSQALAAPDIREKMMALGAEPVGSRPEEFATYIRGETAKYARVVKASGARAD